MRTPYESLPTAVLPNSKCHGCLNFSRNTGTTGTCEKGLQPFNCGGGETPGYGYTPLEHFSPELPDDIAVSGRAAAPGAERAFNSPLVMETQFLGDEHAALAKSIEAHFISQMRSACDFHKQVHGTGFASISVAQHMGISKCGCKEIEDSVIAKALYSTLPNRLRAGVTLQKAEAFVHEVRNGSSVGVEIGTTSSGKTVMGPSSVLVKADTDALRWQLGSAHLRKSCEGWTSDDHMDAYQLHIDALSKALEHNRERDAKAHQYLAHRHAEAAQE